MKDMDQRRALEVLVWHARGVLEVIDSGAEPESDEERARWAEFRGAHDLLSGMLGLTEPGAARSRHEATTRRFKPANAAQPHDPALLGLDAFEVRWSPFEMRLLCQATESGCGELTVALVVPDRETGERFEVTRSERYRIGLFNDPGGPELARDLIQRAVLHELDENLLVGGIRPWDPHTGNEGR